jgi:glycosyltransferase involved in cell wall biosynthesis
MARANYSVHAYLKLRQILREDDIDIVQADYWSAEGFLYALSRNRTAPLVIMAQSSPRDALQTKTYAGLRGWLKLKALSLLADATARRADIVCANSSFSLSRVQSWLRIPSNKMALVPLGIDTQTYKFVPSDIKRELGLPQGCACVLTVGRLEPKKGYHILFEAIPTVLAEIPQTQFIFVGRDSPTAPGGGSFKRYLIDKAREGGFADRLFFIDFMAPPELVKLYSACDLFVLPSLEESFGLVTIEAMACGRPVVVSATGIAPELGLDGTNGVVVPVGDGKALADAIVKMLLMSPQQKFEVSRRNRSIVEERFSLERFGENMLAVYRGVLSDRRGMMVAKRAGGRGHRRVS